MWPNIEHFASLHRCNGTSSGVSSSSSVSLTNQAVFSDTLVGQQLGFGCSRNTFSIQSISYANMRCDLCQIFQKKKHCTRQKILDKCRLIFFLIKGELHDLYHLKWTTYQYVNITRSFECIRVHRPTHTHSTICLIFTLLNLKSR